MNAAAARPARDVPDDRQNSRHLRAEDGTPLLDDDFPVLVNS